MWSKKEQLDELHTRIHILNRDGHVTEKIRQKDKVTAELTKYLDVEFGRCELTAKPELVINGRYIITN